MEKQKMEKQKVKKKMVCVTVPADVHSKLVELKMKTGKSIWFLVSEAVEKLLL